MRHLLAILLLCLAAAASAQVIIIGGQSSSSLPYSGPGDVVSGAKAWWGLRCYNTAYAGNVADVYAPSDASHTLITCSAGGALNETLQTLATTCAVSCTIKTLYDQSGANSCGGGACTVTQATEANRVNVKLNVLGSRYVMDTTAAAPNGLTGGSFTQAQPFTIASAYRNTNAGDGVLIADSGSLVQFRPDLNGANTASIYAGATVSATASDAAFHAVNAVFNAASSSITVDGSTTVVNPSTNGFSNQVDVFSIGAGVQQFHGYAAEFGIWAGSFSGAQLTSMNSNQRAYWRF